MERSCLGTGNLGVLRSGCSIRMRRKRIMWRWIWRGHSGSLIEVCWSCFWHWWIWEIRRLKLLRTDWEIMQRITRKDHWRMDIVIGNVYNWESVKMVSSLWASGVDWNLDGTLMNWVRHVHGHWFQLSPSNKNLHDYHHSFTNNSIPSKSFIPLSKSIKAPKTSVPSFPPNHQMSLFYLTSSIQHSPHFLLPINHGLRDSQCLKSMRTSIRSLIRECSSRICDLNLDLFATRICWEADRVWVLIGVVVGHFSVAWLSLNFPTLRHVWVRLNRLVWGVSGFEVFVLDVCERVVIWWVLRFENRSLWRCESLWGVQTLDNWRVVESASKVLEF